MAKDLLSTGFIERHSPEVSGTGNGHILFLSGTLFSSRNIPFSALHENLPGPKGPDLTVSRTMPLAFFSRPSTLTGSPYLSTALNPIICSSPATRFHLQGGILNRGTHRRWNAEVFNLEPFLFVIVKGNLHSCDKVDRIRDNEPYKRIAIPVGPGLFIIDQIVL